MYGKCLTTWVLLVQTVRQIMSGNAMILSKQIKLWVICRSFMLIDWNATFSFMNFHSSTLSFVRHYYKLWKKINRHQHNFTNFRKHSVYALEYIGTLVSKADGSLLLIESFLTRSLNMKAYFFIVAVHFSLLGEKDEFARDRGDC